MLRTNLSTRPFYNDRLVALALGVVVTLVVALTAVNVERVYHLTSERASLRAEISADHARTTRADNAALAMQKSIDAKLLASLAAGTGEANILITRRAFSWTTLLNLLETTLPPNVRITSIAPQIDQGDRRVQLGMIAKSEEDVADFEDALLKTGQFYDVRPRTSEATDDGMRRVTLSMRYVQTETPPAKSAKGVHP